jgi:hypothetical protein
LNKAGSQTKDIPQSDGSTKTLQQWQIDGSPSLAAWTASMAAHDSPVPPRRALPSASQPNGNAPPNGAPGAAPNSGGAPRTAAVQSDPVLKQALSDPDYKLPTPKVTTGVSATPAQLDQQKATVTARTELMKDSQDATAASAQSLQYLQAAKQIMQSQGKPVVGMFGPAASEISRVFGGVNATNYQEVAKYLGNAALSNAKATYGARMTQSEVGLQLNELSPSTKMTPAAINNLLDTNVRSAQYTIASAQRARQFIGSGGDPQSFADWNEKYFPRAKATNAPSASPQSADNSGAPPRITTPQQLNALPSGTRFVGPDGKTRVKN